MHRRALFLIVSAFAGVIVGISLLILRMLHWAVLSYILIVPIWITVVAVLVLVAQAHSKVIRTANPLRARVLACIGPVWHVTLGPGS
jgi:hypothetical protein